MNDHQGQDLYQRKLDTSVIEELLLVTTAAPQDMPSTPVTQILKKDV